MKREPLAVAVGRRAEALHERPTHRLGAPEAGARRDRSDRVVGLLERSPRRLEPDLGDVLAGRWRNMTDQRATVWAMSTPTSSRTRAHDRSMPAVTPADDHT